MLASAAAAQDAFQLSRIHQCAVRVHELCHNGRVKAVGVACWTNY
jgi:hypothetical protein